MILLDPRRGSGELKGLFKAFDVEVSDGEQLSAGDFAFFGNGEAGLVSVGIERKRISDLVNSIRSKRLSGFQLNELGREYDWVYVVVEGDFRCGRQGDLEEHRWDTGVRKMVWKSMRLLYREVDNYLTTLDHRAGTDAGNHIRLRRTSSPSETVAAVVDLYKWWQKGWNQHNSHEEIYDEYIPAQNGHRYTRRIAGLAEKMAAQLPGVGQMAWDIAKYFKSAERMVNAGLEEWADVDVIIHGKDGDKVQKLGMKRGEKIWREIRR